jgi:molybdate transport system substrate-binding protein
MGRWSFGLVCTAALLLAACSGSAAPAFPASQTAAPAATEAASGRALTVFAAASLTEAFGDIGRSFESAYNVSIAFNFAGSQQLAQQLAQGAPADVFASANVSQMRAAIDAGRISAGTERVFVRNRLVVIHPDDNPANLRALQDLARPGVKLVIAAKEVPVGQYTLDVLDRASQNPGYGPAYRDAVLANVVSYEENVRAVLSKVALGEADAGVVYSSDVAPGAPVGRIEIPDALNTIAEYPIAPVTDSRDAELAQQFIDYVVSDEGQAVLERYNFVSVSQSR